MSTSQSQGKGSSADWLPPHRKISPHCTSLWGSLNVSVCASFLGSRMETAAPTSSITWRLLPGRVDPQFTWGFLLVVALRPPESSQMRSQHLASHSLQFGEHWRGQPSPPSVTPTMAKTRPMASKQQRGLLRMFVGSWGALSQSGLLCCELGLGISPPQGVRGLLTPCVPESPFPGGHPGARGRCDPGFCWRPWHRAGPQRQPSLPAFRLHPQITVAQRLRPGNLKAFLISHKS